MIVPASVQCAAKGNSVCVGNTAAARQAKADTCHFDRSLANDFFLNVVAGGLAFYVIGKRQHKLDDFGGFDASLQAFEV